jgi:hypothetical protein
MPTVLGPARIGKTSLRSRSGTPVFEEDIHYIVQGDYATQPRIEIVTTSGLPQLNLSTSSGGIAVCRGIDASMRSDASLIWDITCQFTSEVQEGQDTSDPSSDPTAWIPVYETKFERLQEIVTKDKNGATIANSAGVPFDVGLTVSRFIPIWELYQFESAALSDEDIIARNEVVNSATFKGRAAKSILCTVLSSVVGFYFGQKRRLTQYQLKYNKKLWTHKRLDVGTTYKSGSTLLPYTDSEGNIILGALDGSGAKQAVGTAPAVEEFDMYDSDALSFLRI